MKELLTKKCGKDAADRSNEHADENKVQLNIGMWHYY